MAAAFNLLSLLVTAAYASATMRLTVKIDPAVHVSSAGTTVAFRCIPDLPETDPILKEVKVTWKFEGVPIENQPRFKVTDDHSLVISRTKELDSGSYQCVVRTPVDVAQAQATLDVTERPSSPVLVGINCQEKMANLQWKPTGRVRTVSRQNYRIEYNTTFTPNIWDTASDDVPATETSWTVQLSPWGNYSFRVWACNGMYCSSSSEHSEVCTTQPDVPYKNPDKVEGRGRAPNNMVISWATMPQIEHNGPGFYYRVSYKRDAVAREDWTHVEVKDWQQSELLVPNTPTFVSYKIKVVAWNSKGSSNVAPVEVIGWSGEDKPLLAPTNFTLVEVISGNEALLSWNPVPPESVRGHFNGYRIQTWTDGEEDQIREFNAKSDATGVKINILKPYKKNNVRIMVYNGFSNGPPSDTLSFVTAEGKPGPVRSFNAYRIGSSAMLLSWGKPMEENGVLTGYKVYYAKVVGTHVEPWVERKNIIDSKRDRAKLAGLEPNTKYRIKLCAMTEAGEGEGSFVESVTRSIYLGLPDEPSFEAFILPPLSNVTRMLVLWTLFINDVKQPGTHFQVFYKLGGDGQWEASPIETEEDYVIIQGLKPNRTYLVKITAYNGPYSIESALRLINTTYVPYDVEIDPKTSIVVVGSKAELRCLPRNNPGFDIRLTWIRKGRPIDYASSYRIRVIKSNTLSIIDAQPQDSGVYQCNVKTSIYEVQADATLIVQYKSFFSGFQIGSSAILLTWDKPTEESDELTGYKVSYAKAVGSELEPWVERKNIIDSDSECTKLTGLQPDTKYLIELRALTNAGTSQSFLAWQTTHSEYSKISRPPAVHMLVRWRPGIQGQPGMYFQGRPIDYASSYRIRVIKSNTLSIIDAQPQDSGVYQCNVKTSIYEVQADATLIVQYKSFFSGFQIGSSAILLTWDKPTEESDELTGYKVSYAKAVGSELEPWVERKNIIDSDSECTKLTGLQPDTKYLIELRALTNAGTSQSFLAWQTTHSEYSKISRPPAVHMLVRWRPGIQGQPGMYFQTSYRLMSQDNPQWEQWQMEADDDYVVVKGVAPNWHFMYCY